MILINLILKEDLASISQLNMVSFIVHVLRNIYLPSVKRKKHLYSTTRQGVDKQPKG